MVSSRPAVERPDGSRPNGFFVEDEVSRSGGVEKVVTVLLAGRECPYRCVMCDLWKGTTVESLPGEMIVAQVDAALGALPPATHLKLYNAGSFFDEAAVPVSAHLPLASRASRFATLTVECHPRLVGDRVARFRGLLGAGTDLEVAMGLETAHEGALRGLNKRMTVDDYATAARRLRTHGIFVRTFVLLGVPGVPKGEQETWALRSIALAFDCGSDVVSLIPVRGGNGAMEALAARGDFTPPTLEALERVQRAGLGMRRGRVFADLWDVDRFEAESRERDATVASLRSLNRTQAC